MAVAAAVPPAVRMPVVEAAVHRISELAGLHWLTA
jgi:hypothetical protein